MRSQHRKADQHMRGHDYLISLSNKGWQEEKKAIKEMAQSKRRAEADKWKS